MFEDRMLIPPSDSSKVFTHVVVVCDTFDHEDYPVFVSAEESVRRIYDEHNGKNMQRVMEVYDLTESEKPLSEQKREHRSFNFGDPAKIAAWVTKRRAEQALKSLSTEALEAELKRRKTAEATEAQATKVSRRDRVPEPPKTKKKKAGAR